MNCFILAVVYAPPVGHLRVSRCKQNDIDSKLFTVLTKKGFVALSIGLGLEDVRNTYQRSALGPLWTTIGLGIQVLAIGLVFGFLFGADLTTYFPFLVVSLVLWNLILSTLTEASGCYVESERFIRQVQTPFFFPLARLLSKTVITFLHNLVLVFTVLIVYPKDWTAAVLLVLVGLVLLVGNLYWVVVLVALGGGRFRDIGPIVTAIFTVSFYVTPIIWMPSALPPEITEVLLPHNPLFHLMEIVRGPLLGYSPEPQSWLFAGVMVVVGNAFAWLVAKRYWWRVVYWL